MPFKTALSTFETKCITPAGRLAVERAIDEPKLESARQIVHAAVEELSRIQDFPGREGTDAGMDLFELRRLEKSL